ncbi:hypothetical protein WBG78_28025 [Chryseolinea sp. T2]|uniref:hypothetical protein n=1 Tax=Chryseolinea sp. T2 TaxID=3129255 RepID=UPI0030789A3C
MNERRSFNYQKLVRITAFVVIPAVLLSLLLVYGRLYGMRQALQELVRTETDNHYALSIGKTEIRLRSLSFSFHDVKITRVKSDTTSGVKFVQVPEFDLQFGSLRSLFSKQLDISLLVAKEPHITIVTGHRRVERSMITKQIIDLYPVIESILAGFNIQSLNVSRATLQFIQDDEEIFRVRYVDLNIKDWRMRDLSNTSQLRINIEKQNLDLGKANLNFSGVEYNYLKHHLVFTDFSVSAADSASGSIIEITGKALKLSNLDYPALYNELRYDLKRAEIVEPIITAKFQWRKGRKSREINRDIVTRMVKQTIGECRLDSALISKARVHLELRQAEDTVTINLPQVDFRLHTFAVTKDSSNFVIGEMQVNLNGSALSLPGNWTVELDEVLFDRHRDLTLKNIAIKNAVEPSPIATLSTLRIGYFNLIALIFQQRFIASTIHAEGGNIDLHHFAKSAVSSDSALRAPELLVHNLSLKDIDLSYRSKKTSIEVKGLSFRGTHFRTNDEGLIRYQLKSVSADEAQLRAKEIGLQATLNDLTFNGERLNARKVKGMKDSLTVAIENFETEISGSTQKIRSLKYISADRLLLEGRLPVKNNTRGQKHEAFSLGRLDIGSVQVKLSLESTKLSFNARNLRTDQLQFAESVSWPRHVSGELTDVIIKSQNTDAHIGQLEVDYPRRLSGTSIKLSGPKYHLDARTAIVRRPAYQQHWTIERMLLDAVHLSSGSRTLNADSISIASARLTKDDPQADRIDIYKPVATLSSPATTEKSESKARLLDALPAHHLYLHPGEITLANNHKVEFGLVHADRQKQIVRASYVSTALKKSNLTMRNVVLEPGRVAFDSVLLIPNRKWYSSLEVEETQIATRFGQVAIREFFIEQYLRKRTVDNLEVDVGYADFDLRRNKLLPDPPPNRKPVTLDGLIPLPENVRVSTVTIRDGRIRYRQISDKTGEEGYIIMDKLAASARFDSLSSFIMLHASTKLYQSGAVQLNYKTLAKDKFQLDIQVRDMDLTKFNEIVMPLQSLRIKSGYLKEYKLSIHADDEAATGNATISYDGLHLELFKHDEPERKSLGTEVLSLLADGIILKHSKENAQSAVNHPRVKHKSVFHYWVTSAIQGATGAIRRGKKQR